MLRKTRARGHAIIAITLLGLTLMSACGEGDEENGAQDPNGGQTANPEPVVFTIGNHTDMTGMSSKSMGATTLALQDLADYYNDQNLIPGVRLEVISFDSQYQESRDIPGYESLIERGADILFTPIASTAANLKPIVDRDGVILFTIAASEEAILPPGYVFSGAVLPKDFAYTALSWIADNDWDHTRQGPARIGVVGMDSGYLHSLVDGVEEYCLAHPDQFEYYGGYLTEFKFTWGPEVESLKDCDYVFPPVPVLGNFVREFRAAGATGKFFGAEAHAAFLEVISTADLWDEFDGTLLLRTSRWWNEDGEVIDLTRKLLYDNHPDKTSDVVGMGAPYIGAYFIHLMLQVVAEANETVGPENLDSRAVFEAAESFTIEIDGCPHSFSQSKRISSDSVGVYEMSLRDKDLNRLGPDWIPIRYEP